LASTIRLLCSATVGQGCKAVALAWQHQSSTGGLAIFKSLSRWRRFVSSLQSAEGFVKSALGVGSAKRRCEVDLLIFAKGSDRVMQRISSF